MKRKYAFAARFLVTASLTSDRLLAHNADHVTDSPASADQTLTGALVPVTQNALFLMRKERVMRSHISTSSASL